MTTQTHTPAPWTLSKPSGVYIESATGGIAALTYSAREADAYLIAAAPDLLAALHEVDEFCQQGLDSPYPEHGEEALNDIMGLVRVAIAKAKGA